MIRLIKEISPKQREWRNSPEIMKWTRGSELLSEEDQKKWLNKIESDKSISMFGISLEETSKIKGMVRKPKNIGTCGLTGISFIHRTAEWSLLIAPEYQGNGHATEAFRLLLAYGFQNLNMNRIHGEIFDGNEASLHLAKKFGFKEEGKLRQTYYKNGKFIGSTIVGLLREEWEQAAL